MCHCSKIAATEYKKRRDGVTKIVNWNLTRQYGFKTSKKWYDHKTETVLQNQNAKILMQTDHVIQARRPDIVVKDKELDHTWLIDIAVPGDRIVNDREREKVKKYQGLTRKLRKIWDASVTVVPIMFGALGAVCNVEEELIKLNLGKKQISKLQICCIAGIGENIKERFGSPWLAVLTNSIQPTASSCRANFSHQTPVRLTGCHLTRPCRVIVFEAQEQL